MNKKCNTSFQKSPESLVTEHPKDDEVMIIEKRPQKRNRKNETENSGS
jgi:hypothetical protein